MVSQIEWLLHNHLMYLYSGSVAQGKKKTNVYFINYVLDYGNPNYSSAQSGSPAGHFTDCANAHISSEKVNLCFLTCVGRFHISNFLIFNNTMLLEDP